MLTLHAASQTNMKKDIKNIALQWVKEAPVKAMELPSEYYCQTRDIFQARLDKMTIQLLQTNLSEGAAYLVSAMAGEVGNNSFDHNLGQWPNIPGVFFGYDFSSQENSIVLADRGRGILSTLQK